jgi:glutamine synthetase
MSVIPASEIAFQARLSALGANEVHLGIFDLDGLFRHKLVDARKAAKLVKSGYSFCDVLYAWDSAERTYSDHDAYVDRPCFVDVSSLRPYPLGDAAAVCIADFVGEFGERSPRNQALRLLEQAADLGFEVWSAFEFEFFLLQETPDTLRAKQFSNLDHFAKANRTYSLQSSALYGELLGDLKAAMATLGVVMDSIHSELGPGCFEAPIAVEIGIRAADNAALFKNFAKAFFLRRDLSAVFMSKLSADLPGQSGHFHISLRNRRDGSPAFSDSAERDGLSVTARHFIGGLIRIMPEALALCSHTVNAYKRLVPSAWAPTSANGGVQNRTCALRIVNDSPETTRIEFRVPSADTNPYSAMALCLGAGLWGVRHEIEPPQPAAGSQYGAEAERLRRFPRDLFEAAERLDRSKVAREIFGDVFVDHFVMSRRVEAEAYSHAVSPWEIQRYLEIT